MACQASQACQAPGLLKGLNAVITGAVQVQDFARVLVTEAVEDALLRVARDHGLEYRLLVAKYRDDLVQTHAVAAPDASLQCQGLTARGKRCGKRTVMNGHCQAHADQASQDASQRRCVEAYKQRVAKSRPADPVAEAVRDVSRLAPAPGLCPVPPANSMDLL